MADPTGTNEYPNEGIPPSSNDGTFNQGDVPPPVGDVPPPYPGGDVPPPAGEPHMAGDVPPPYPGSDVPPPAGEPHMAGDVPPPYPGGDVPPPAGEPHMAGDVPPPYPDGDMPPPSDGGWGSGEPAAAPVGDFGIAAAGSAETDPMAATDPFAQPADFHDAPPPPADVGMDSAADQLAGANEPPPGPTGDEHDFGAGPDAPHDPGMDDDCGMV